MILNLGKLNEKKLTRVGLRGFLRGWLQGEKYPAFSRDVFLCPIVYITYNVTSPTLHLILNDLSSLALFFHVKVEAISEQDHFDIDGLSVTLYQQSIWDHLQE